MPKAIETTYHGATKVFPARITATDLDGNKITISSDSSRVSVRIVWVFVENDPLLCTNGGMGRVSRQPRASQGQRRKGPARSR